MFSGFPSRLLRFEAAVVVAAERQQMMKMWAGLREKR
jgi:hypothetical protein